MNEDEICRSGVAEQAGWLREGLCSSRELVSAYLSKVDRHDRLLNAFKVVLRREALEAADSADDALAQGDEQPLLGVPIAVKESIAIAGLPTSNGTDAVTRRASTDSTVVSRLRRSGAIVLGATRAPELCMTPFSESCFAGPTRNPWSTAHTPGGSSSGSAASVAGGLVGAALGDDAGGSVRIPAAWTGLFGFRPTTDRIPSGAEPVLWNGMSSPGPLTRTVRDAALVADQLIDKRPALSMPLADAASVEPGALRIAYSLRPWGLGVRVSDDVRRALLDTVRLLADLGHSVWEQDPEFAEPTLLFSYAPRFFRAAALGREQLDKPTVLERRTRQMAAIGRLFTDRTIARSRQFGLRVADRANRVFRDADLLLTPVTPRTALRVGEWQGRSFPGVAAAMPPLGSFTALWNIAGNPTAAIPAGWNDDNLPLSVQVIGRHYDECGVLSLAGQLERVRPWTQRTPHLDT